MPIDHAFLDELTARSDIVDVVSRHVSPNGRAPTILVCVRSTTKSRRFRSRPQQIYHCFVAAGGGVINFVMRAEDWNFATRYSF
ncbi:MAG: CHC2 zinc finger domain-containing protein [Butyricicoccus sp.]